MIHYSKGIHTKQRITSVSKHLFYARGYKNVTIREISAASEVNLGLLHYYFNGKGDLGMTIYMEVRHVLNEEIKRYFPNRTEVEYFLLSSAAELLICLQNRRYGDFYLQMSKEPAFRKDVNETIISTILKYSAQENPSNRAILSSLSTMATKPALVEHAYAHPGLIDHSTYLQYYMEMQIYQLHMQLEKGAGLLSELQGYAFAITDDFTPVITSRSTQPAYAPGGQ